MDNSRCKVDVIKFNGNPEIISLLLFAKALNRLSLFHSHPLFNPIRNLPLPAGLELRAAAVGRDRSEPGGHL